jgi:hypothetical protein
MVRCNRDSLGDGRLLVLRSGRFFLTSSTHISLYIRELFCLKTSITVLYFSVFFSLKFCHI